MDEFDTIVEIISEFLGEPKKVYETMKILHRCLGIVQCVMKEEIKVI